MRVEVRQVAMATRSSSTGGLGLFDSGNLAAVADCHPISAMRSRDAGVGCGSDGVGGYPMPEGPSETWGHCEPAAPC